KCGKPMVIRYGRFGKFMACSGFPDCKNVKSITEPTGLIRPEDGGEVVQRRTKKGRMFWGCGNYPKCKFASWTKPEAPKSSDDTTQKSL
ncbi:topoisomerase DNA-binding C4 zinc finger domain-containing protein, partial [Candidatus Curtissbacteria bacterium]|nr:topoisomerase DNA-binding C4 zinc finger domain-containing protein [Candidatus Curtissbacteria bacterium]